MPLWLVYPIVVIAEWLDWLFARARRVAAAVVVLAVAYVAWNLVPPYAAHWSLQDELRELARRHGALSQAPGDTPELRQGLMHAVRSRKLEAYVSEADFHIAATAFALRISCRYAVDVQVLPGRTHTLHFRLDVDEPVLPKPGTVFF